MYIFVVLLYVQTNCVKQLIYLNRFQKCQPNSDFDLKTQRSMSLVFLNRRLQPHLIISRWGVYNCGRMSRH